MSIMPTEKMTDEQKREWTNATISRRAEFNSRVYEYDIPNNVVFVLRRTSSAPSKPNICGHLELVNIIREPDMQLRVKINQHAEKYFPGPTH